MKAPAAVAPHRPDVFSTPHQLMTNHHLHITIGHQAVDQDHDHDDQDHDHPRHMMM